jgi:hypothetical protein
LLLTDNIAPVDMPRFGKRQAEIILGAMRGNPRKRWRDR